MFSVGLSRGRRGRKRREATISEFTSSEAASTEAADSGATAETAAACPSCGAEGRGNFCARCGTALRREGRPCPACGRPARGEALFCTECGEPLAPRPHKGWKAHLPWILAGLTLAAFSVGIALLVQRQAGPRGADGLITGGIPEPSREAAPAGAAGGTGGPTAEGAAAGMPTAEELAAMPPRQAADRLFDRAMMEAEGEDPERARFFAGMGLQAYERVPADRLDGDARFHIGLLHLVLGNTAAARAEAERVLEARPRHLLGLLLAAQAAEAAGDSAAAREAYRDLRRTIDAGEPLDDTEYAPHRALIEREAQKGEGG